MIPGYINDEMERCECGHLDYPQEISEDGLCVNCAELAQHHLSAEEAFHASARAEGFIDGYDREFYSRWLERNHYRESEETKRLWLQIGGNV